jgi:ribosomal protein L27
MSLKFYLDTHVDKQVAIQLRQRGVEVARCEEVGMAEADDEDHLIYAAEHGFALLTKDAGFRARHFRWLVEGKRHGGIFFCPDRHISAIGKIVTQCYAYFQLIDSGAGTVQDIENEFFEIR